MRKKDTEKQLKELILKKNKAKKPGPPAIKVKATQPKAGVAKEESVKNSGRLEHIHEGKMLYKGILNYYIMGSIPLAFEGLKVTLVVTEETSHKRFSDKIDFYLPEEVCQAKELIAREFFIEEALVGNDLLTLASLLETHRDEQVIARKVVLEETGRMSHGEETFARSLLRGGSILLRIDQLLEKAGIVGQKDIRLLLFLAASSYKSAVPLHLGIIGNPDMVKELVEKIASFIPAEDRLLLNNVSNRAFYHSSDSQLTDKAMFLPDGLERKAAKALKLLQQNKPLTTATTAKDTLGDMGSAVKQIKGHFSSITHLEDSDESKAGILRVYIDQSEEQMKTLLQYRNNKYAGQNDDYNEESAVGKLRHILYCLEPVEVINPYAGKIIIPSRPENMVTVNDIFQALVKQICLIRQHAIKKDKEGRLVAELQDIESACEIFANAVAIEAEGLPIQAKVFFNDLKAHVKNKAGDEAKEYWFTMKELRDEMGISKTGCFRYMKQLQDMEYVEDDKGNKNTGLKYRVIIWDETDKNSNKMQESIKAQLDKLGVPGVPHKVGTPQPANRKASNAGVPSAA